MVTKLVKISLIAIVTVVFVLIIVAVALNQLTNDSPGSPLINPTPTQTSAANPSASPTKTSNPTSTNSAQQTPTPKPTTTGTNPAPTIQPTPTPTSPSTATPTIQPVPTSIAPTPTPPPTPTATPRPPLTVTFDFDTATPTMRPSMNTPFSQTTSGVTAQFSSPTDPAAFSIQSYDTTLYRLSQFTGNYISDNRPTRDTLEVRFNQSITSVTFTFATFEYHGGPNSQPSNITMIAYMDSTTNPVGSTTARGTWPTGGNAFPQGTLTYSSNAPFNYIKIDLPYQSQQGANDYLIDNLIIITS